MEREVERKQQEIKDLERTRRNYLWVEKAIEEYRARESSVGVGRRRVHMIVAVLSLGATIFSLLLTLIGIVPPEFGVLTALAGATMSGLFAALHIRERERLAAKAFDIHELEAITREFERRFGEKLTGLASLSAMREELAGDYHRQNTLGEQVREILDELNALEVKIKDELRQLGHEGVEKGRWPQAISDIEQELRELESGIERARMELAGLNVDPSDYLESDPGLPYQAARMEELEGKEKALERRLEDSREDLRSLKQRICDRTGDDISIGWDELILHLQEKRQEAAADYKAITAEILAKILVNQELEVIRQGEDEKIQRSLDSGFVTEPLHQITGRYEQVRLQDDQLMLSDGFSHFPLADLSTGAQEQVLLALRIGCAAQVLGKDRLFLILDDAFQHADWTRRERLLDEVVRLAENGWQIIYLTMDDHIRDLIRNGGEKVFKDDFAFFDLETFAARMR
jgi:uncharacterized protein YhaN